MPFAGWEAERAGRFHKKHLRWAYAIEEWCGPCSAAREVELRKPDNRDSRQGMIDVYHALGKRGEDEGAGPSCPLLRSAAAIAGMVRAVQSRSRGERQQGPADFIKFLRSAAAIAGMVQGVHSCSRGGGGPGRFSKSSCGATVPPVRRGQWARWVWVQAPWVGKGRAMLQAPFARRGAIRRLEKPKRGEMSGAWPARAGGQADWHFAGA